MWDALLSNIKAVALGTALSFLILPAVERVRRRLARGKPIPIRWLQDAAVPRRWYGNPKNLGLCLLLVAWLAVAAAVGKLLIWAISQLV